MKKKPKARDKANSALKVSRTKTNKEKRIAKQAKVAGISTEQQKKIYTNARPDPRTKAKDKPDLLQKDLLREWGLKKLKNYFNNMKHVSLVYNYDPLKFAKKRIDDKTKNNQQQKKY